MTSIGSVLRGARTYAISNSAQGDGGPCFENEGAIADEVERRLAQQLDLKRIILEDDFQRRVQQKTEDVRKHIESKQSEAARHASEANAALQKHVQEAFAKEATRQAEAHKSESKLRDEASSLETMLHEERQARDELARRLARFEGKDLEAATERELLDVLEKLQKTGRHASKELRRRAEAREKLAQSCAAEQD